MARPKGIPHSDEWKKHMSKVMKKMWATKKHRDKATKGIRKNAKDPGYRSRMSKSMKMFNRDNPGCNSCSDETRDKISKALTGKPHPHTKEQDRNIGKALKGHRVSEETRLKISASKKGCKYPPMSEETRRKIGKAHRGKEIPQEMRDRISKTLKKHFKTEVGKDQLRLQSKRLKKFYKENPEKAHENMSYAMNTNTKWKDTEPEKQTKAILDKLGVNYKAQGCIAGLPKPHYLHHWDFILRSEKITIEVDGCWWHGCPEHTTKERCVGLSEQNKMEMLRDCSAEVEGWLVLRFWQCQIREQPELVAKTILNAIEHQNRIAA
jgi:DNA mismatch endonuclease (patch repair protein)